MLVVIAPAVLVAFSRKEKGGYGWSCRVGMSVDDVLGNGGEVGVVIIRSVVAVGVLARRRLIEWEQICEGPW
jgi:hypothetical protein